MKEIAMSPAEVLALSKRFDEIEAEGYQHRPSRNRGWKRRMKPLHGLYSRLQKERPNNDRQQSFRVAELEALKFAIAILETLRQSRNSHSGIVSTKVTDTADDE